MYRVTILYPTTEGAAFDHDYYLQSHIPMVADRLGSACTGWGVDKVISGPYVAAGYLMVNDLDAFNTKMGEHGAEIIGDVANYTTIAPQMVISEVRA